MTAVLNESIPTTYDRNESVSPTAGGLTPVISSEPPAEDDSADIYKELRSARQLEERRENRFIPPKKGYGGYSMWSGVGTRYLFKSQSAEGFPEGLSGDSIALEQTLEQIGEDAREEGLPELPEIALQNVYNAFTVYPVSSPSSYPESRLGGHFTSQSVEGFPIALADTFVGIEQFGDDVREEVLPDQLANALRELDELNDEAKEEGIEPPSESAMTDAKRVLRAIYDILPRDYVMDFFPEGVIAIIVPGGFKRSVMVLCESDGGALCSVNMNGKHRRKRYLRTDQLLLDSFLREALRELERE